MKLEIESSNEYKYLHLQYLQETNAMFKVFYD